ncbi:MAG: FtsX-like permease family protein [Desulfovibrionaceae bacterium]|nr:FtsX-like permease family protein [Desulfovibrionaceae bacterium]
MRHLAFKNLKGRKAYSAIIITAVAVAVVMTLFALFMTDGLRRELENNRRMLGPDLAVVPVGSKERGHIYLSKGPPSHGEVPAEIFEQLGAFPELEAVSPQKRLGTAALGAVQATLFGFDPVADFAVRPWLDMRNTEKFPGQDDGLVLGAKVPADKLPATLPAADSLSAARGGRLLATGTFMDTSIFIPRPAAEIAAEPSWILLRLRPEVSLDIAANRLEVNIARIEVLRRPELFKTINDQIHRLLEGGGFGAAAFLTIVIAILVTGAVFALMAHERKRELGILKAMGAGNSFVFKLVMGEAALLGVAGAVFGAGLALVCLFCAHTGIAFTEIPLTWSADAALVRDIFAVMALIVVVAVLTALYPALAATRLEPYAAIRGGE